MSKAATIQAIAPPRSRPTLDADDWVVRVALFVFGAYFLVALVVPLFMMVSRSVQNIRGEFVGLDNYILYFQTPALFQSINNSFFVAGLSTVIVIVLAFIYAYALTAEWSEFLEIRQDVLVNVMRIVDGSGTRLALPTEVHYTASR